MGSLEKVGAVNDTDTDVPVPSSVAVPIVGALAGPLVAPADELRIGIGVFYTIFILMSI